MNATIENNFRYHPPMSGQPQKYEALRAKAKELAYLIDQVCPPSRERSLAETNLEQAVMWANASIARQPSIVPDEIRQAEYRAALKCMPEAAALDHIRKFYPTFEPDKAGNK